jgi:DNA-binding response OmpR family regulator
MSEVWIYAPASPVASHTARMLAELGFSPHRVDFNGSLRPRADARQPALAVLAGEDFPEICARLRDDELLCNVPCLIALDPEDLEAAEVHDGHELIVRPFTAAELRARIARARRALHGVEAGDVVRIGTLEVNLATYQVTIDGRPVDFTHMEYELLKFLVTHSGRVFSREALLSAVWGYDYYGGARTVDVHVRRVRAKLGQEHAARIRTVRSVGYRFDP